ncbi:hypothetical protein HYR99_32845 [Candidatus Poribacteria bacterium]|nr:hypothetical protein [Candidatus Poribacteria bacterium]
MNEFNLPYMAFVIVDGHTITLMEQLVSKEEPCFKREVGEERCFELRVDNLSIGEIGLLAWHQPRIAVSASHVAVWGGTRIYIAPLTGKTLRFFDQEEEIHAAYPVGNRWCFVCELSVRLFDLDSGAEVARFDHNEVLLESWWSDDSLIVEDFQGRRMKFNALAIEPELRPQYG